MGSRQEALNLEPFAQPLNPVVAGPALLRYTEAMTTFGIDVQFDWMACSFPCGIEEQTSIRDQRDQRIITGKSKEQRGHIGWNSEIWPTRTVDRRYEIRTTLCLVLRGNAGGDDPTRRETEDANPPWVGAPCGSPLPYHSDGLFSILHCHLHMR